MSARIPQVFAANLITHLPALRRYALALCGNPALADDLVQDGIERAITRASTVRDPQRIGAWLRTIVHNLFIDELRRRRTQGVSVDVTTIENDLAVSTVPPDRWTADDLAQAMAGLSVEHRQILVLVAVEELSYREIAEELAVPLGTVMSRLSRARAALRLALEPQSRHLPVEDGR